MREVSSIAFSQAFAADGLLRVAVPVDPSITSAVMASSSEKPLPCIERVASRDVNLEG